QMVRLLRGGEPVKMSKRAGDFVTLRDVVEEVGRDAVRFMMLMRKNDAPLDFDLAKVIEQSKDNPVFYVQYAHARCRSTFRAVTASHPNLVSPEALEKAELSRLDDEGELSILKRLAQYPRLIEQAASAHEPHRVAFYLYELASDFHTHWNRGKDLPHLRFIRDDDEMLTSARLALVRGVETVLASGLSLLGVAAPEEMR
ncbi:MAG: DALR anticodon-binding domain-containing protein, partial [Hyphomicrobiales bacterium]